ncbi:DUF6701 domain-containing protein [Thalassolituus hydrocarboniclasticus]|uniref:MshQ-like protein n=1 Tax=Thalassolituus hydrocarboniclasticus TaxID=2742796 RepID=A0ABY6A6B9_9GAMM|nr:DUF6701 domain-containing protein [Thalassolituus hydrocarboniclasticus]UXD86567.1 MshQ-like protein [Thalassolituus hydrocarboniclasticus]
MTGKNGATLSFWWRRGDDSFSEDPDGNEDLIIYILLNNTTWVELDRFAGNGTAGESGLAEYELPAAAMYTGLRIRFQLDRGNGPDNDYWHVDDVKLTESRGYCGDDFVIFCDDFERSSLGADWSVTSAGGNAGISSATSRSPTRSLNTNSGIVGVQLKTLDLSFYSEVTVEYWWRRGDDAFSEDPDPGEDLVAEYRTDNGSWIVLQTILGNGLTGDTGNSSFTLPASALSSNFQFRFRQTGGNSGGNDYFHLDDLRIKADSAPLTCFTDDFNRSSAGNDWVTSAVSGSFTPSLVNNRLRLTQDVTYQSTASTLQRLFPAANNIVVIEFTHYAWSTSFFGTGADGISVVFSDATITPQSGSFGGSLGYAQRDNGDPGFAGGWLGIGLDEYGNFSNPTEGRIGGPGARSDSVTIRGSGSGSSGYRYLTGTNSLSPGVDQRPTSSAGGPAHRYRFVIDSRVAGQSLVSVQRDTGSGYATLVAPVNIANINGQAAIPQNLLLSLTGSTGASSNNHEIDRLRVCANTINPIGPIVHHFEMDYASSGLTCSPQEVLIRACANASCSSLYTDPVTVTLAPSGWQGGNVQTFSGGSATLALRQNIAGSVNLQVLSSVPVSQAFTSNLCSRDGGALSTNCSMTFADSGFVLDIPDFPAGLGTSDVLLKAVKKDDSTQACVPGFANVSRDVVLNSQYIDPGNSSRVVSWPVTVNGNNIADISASPVTLTLNFDANGQTPLQINYADAGLMQLNVRYEGSGSEAGLVMSGNDRFVSYPAGFCIQTDANAGECNPASAANYAGCPAFAKAGDNFNLNISAVGWQSAADTDFCDNTPTPGFALTDMALSTELVAPSGGVNAVLTPAQYNHNAAVDNKNILAANVSEVGVFNIRLTAGSNYHGVTLPAAVSTAIGRFYPHHFAVSEQSGGQLKPFCSVSAPFAYSGQDIRWELAPVLRLEAQNAANVTTLNYTQSGFMKLLAGNAQFMVPAEDNSALANDGLPITLSTVLQSGNLAVSADAGVLNYTLNVLQDSFTYTKETRAKINPFSPDITLILSRFADADNTDISAPLALNPAAAFELRYGRLWLEDSYGPETQPLQMPARTEYFSDGRFWQNNDDSCWNYNSIINASVLPSTLTSVLGNSRTLASGRNTDAVLLQAPVLHSGTPDTGTATVSFSVPVWLQDDFDNNGSLDEPEAMATFGIYRGHDRVIYWREVRP